jgi:hypothetical protein
MPRAARHARGRSVACCRSPSDRSKCSGRAEASTSDPPGWIFPHPAKDQESFRCRVYHAPTVPVRRPPPSASPRRPIRRPPAAGWPDWTDNFFWEPGESPAALSDHVTLVIPEPEETDAEFLARLGHEEEIEKARVLATYQPSPTDLAEYAAWSEALDNGTLPPAAAVRFRLGEYDAIRRGQISEDELAQLAAHGCI